MKKKISPIKLHNLSEAEMETRELNLLRGGSGTDQQCPCVTICMPQNCICSSGGPSSSIKEVINEKLESSISDLIFNGNKDDLSK